MKKERPDENWHFENRQRKIAFDETAIRDFLLTVGLDLAPGLGFSVVVSSDAAVRKANADFRNVRRTTDVLSFPDGEDDYLGDVLISAPRASRQAAEQGHSIEEEIQILVLHALLHLRGYDHESDNGAMRDAEERLRLRYGLAPGLVGRSTA